MEKITRNGKSIYIYKEKVGTVGKPLILLTAFKWKKTKSRSGFIAEATPKHKKALIDYALKRYAVAKR